ncbi:hypothetical protein BCR44DRAFT_116056 [Catenaria anguillulae PL171]|uniref:Phospholipid/glycerol acyltransferase domain-containing protein n=1 Tax=Catenaria anguillulae PL171 TaxID=765915 RepID=A0A1Y2HEI9_9FUNG|nr:hypothetical protein BCR44DRAFT_116056 [Catenaria anguillulae PL171]
MPHVTSFAISKWINVRRHALKAKHAIKLSFFGTLFALILAISNLFQVAALFLRPIHKKTVAAVNSKVLRAVWGYIQYMLERRHGAQITFSGDVMHLPYNIQRTMPWTQRDDLPPPASAFVIANHLFFCDFVLEHAVAIRRNMLGHCRYLSKDSHKYWPLFGWLIRLAGFVFLKRNWEQDQALISRRIAEWKAGNQAIWMVVYPEGTRQTPSKLAQSQAWSKKHDKPMLSNLLFPRTKGFVAILKQLRASHFTHVLDFTVAAYHLPTGTFNQVFPTGFDLFSKRLDTLWKFHVHVDQFDITDLPEEDAAVEAWLIDRWVVKDKRLQEWREKWPVVGESGGECTGDVYDMPWPWS